MASLVFWILILLMGIEATAWDAVVDFSLTGDTVLYSYGIYLAELKVGTPARAFSLIMDTGSDITWIMCAADNTSMANSGRYDPSRGKVIRCGDELCGSTFPRSGECSSPSQPCPYSINYEDGTGSSGFYIADTFHFKMKGANSTLFESPADLVFGCATEVRGSFSNDGIMGLTFQKHTIISQLYKQGKFPRIFSSCFKGGYQGGGFLVFGQVKGDVSLSYTPLVPSKYYTVMMESIALDGKKLIISDTAFAKTIVDSGTTSIILIQDAYDPLITAITSAVDISPYKGGFDSRCCYWGDLKSLMAKFPIVALNMKGDISLALHPSDYLFQDETGFTCIGFRRSLSGDFNIIGELGMKDKLVVYDLNVKRIGWSSFYNCSVSPNVTLIYSMQSSAHNTQNGTQLLFLLSYVLALLLY